MVAIMPEGTIPRGPAFFEPELKGRWGAARLAQMTGATVIPIGLWGTEKVWPRSARAAQGLQRRRCADRDSRPVGDPVELKGKSLDKDTKRIMNGDLRAAAARVADPRVTRPPRSWPRPIRPGTGATRSAKPSADPAPTDRRFRMPDGQPPVGSVVPGPTRRRPGSSTRTVVDRGHARPVARPRGSDRRGRRSASRRRSRWRPATDPGCQSSDVLTSTAGIGGLVCGFGTHRRSVRRGSGRSRCRRRRGSRRCRPRWPRRTPRSIASSSGSEIAVARRRRKPGRRA